MEYWYSLLGLHLAHHGTESRIRILLDDLLGAAFTNSLEALQGKRTANETILVCDKVQTSCSDSNGCDCVLPISFLQGIEKHKILSKVLEHLKSVPKWQRIYMEYLDQLNAINFQANGMVNIGDKK